MNSFKIVAALGMIVWAGAGCQKIEVAQEIPKITWEAVSDGMERIELPLRDASSTHVIAYAFDTEKFSFDFAYSTTAKTIASWMPEYPKAAAILNGVYFHEDYTPSGDLIDEGKRTTNRRFDLDKSEYLVLAPVFGIGNSTGSEAGQSYPMLVRDGKDVVEVDSGKTARRTFAGIRDDGKAVFGLLDEGEISLYALSRELARPELGLEAALNLDGGPSTGMVVREPDESINSIFAVPVVIVITRK
ncbi:phosphodiester glycosidase family protein [Candidatus Uhrbacteria bacterium]|nr:phosphodiester glycosidase family protein [Candidatus Uhrbacteria bacterium]